MKLIDTRDFFKLVLQEQTVSTDCTFQVRNAFQSQFSRLIIFSRYFLTECFSSTLKNPGQPKPELKEMSDKKGEKKDIKPRQRYLTDEMLEEYRLLSEESGMYRRPYEEAAFKVYGTLPNGTGFFNAAMKIKRGSKF